MDPKRKKIYIIVSVVCLVLAVGILVWSKVSTPTVDDTSSLVNRPATPAAASGDYTIGFRAPAVFPATDKFNTDVLSTAAYKALQSYTPVNVGQDLGRPDPFKNY